MSYDIEQPPRGKVWKTGSNSIPYLADDPDYTDDNGAFRKYRKKGTNVTPKKRRRK